MTHNRETGGYKHGDIGTDVLYLKDKHLWTDIHDAERGPHNTYHNYLYVSCKGESTFSYLVCFKAVRKVMAIAWGWTDVKIMVVGGDP